MERAISQPLQLNKVLKKEGIEKYFNLSCWLWLFAFFILPDAFGFRLGFLFSAKRIMLFVCYAQILINSERYNRFWKCIKSVKYFHIILALYMFVRIYTGILRFDINTFAYELLDGLMVFYLFIYILKYEISVNKVCRFIYGVFVFLSIYSVFEYFVGINLFAFLHTTQVGYTGSVVRNGSERVLANCHHPIHFGIYISILFFISCIDFKNNRINLFLHKPAFFLALWAVYSCGSRGPLGIFIIFVFVALVFSNKDQRIIAILIFILFIIVMMLFVAVNINNQVGFNIMKMITSTIDGMFGTNISKPYVGTTLDQSTEYRKNLLSIFHLGIFNGLLGQGGSYQVYIWFNNYYINSIDNAYVLMFIQVAYPGLITFVLLLASMLGMAIFCAYKTKHKFFVISSIIMTLYAINIWYVALMGTFMYIWMLYAMIFVVYEELKKKKEGEEKCNQNL